MEENNQLNLKQFHEYVKSNYDKLDKKFYEDFNNTIPITVQLLKIFPKLSKFIKCDFDYEYWFYCFVEDRYFNNEYVPFGLLEYHQKYAEEYNKNEKYKRKNRRTKNQGS